MHINDILQATKQSWPNLKSAITKESASSTLLLLRAMLVDILQQTLTLQEKDR